MKYYWVYILLCKNGSYYTGFTTNLKRRYQEHVSGSYKCKYTRSFSPLSIAQSWRTEDKNTALRIECHIKKMSKAEKEHLILQPKYLMELFCCEVNDSVDES